MEPGIPNISPHGTRTGDFSGVQYNSSDPTCWWSWSKCTTPKLAGLPDDTTRCAEPNTWGLTFDDGPNCSHNAFYDYLQTANQKATMNFIGSNVVDWPLQAQRALADGHEICVHTWSHPYMTAMTNEEAFAELYYAKKAIKDVIGVTPRCWRPPFGDVDDRIRYIAHQLDMSTLMWIEDTNDYNWVNVGIPKVQQNYQNIIAGGTAGNYTTQGLIVLQHELNNETMSLADQFLPSIQKTFTGGVMPVAVCQNNSRPYIEQENVYPNYSQWMAGTRSVSLAAPTAAGDVTVQLVAPSTTAMPTATGSGATMSSGSATAKTAAANAAKASSTTPTSEKHNGAGSTGASSVVAVLAAILAMAAHV